MLLEIRCDEFKSHGKRRPPIVFHSGLNTVLGDKEGSNSIGKSTFLLIVDFAFGGDDYIKSDAARNVDPHTIYFSFMFNDKTHYFARDTISPERVGQCDEGYSVKDYISIRQFRDSLFLWYSIQRKNLTFRDAVGRYLRVYGRDNLSEKRPLLAAARESDESAITALLKLFGKYERFEQLKLTEQESKDKQSAFKAALKYDFIPSTTNKKSYMENERQIKSFRDELTSLTVQADRQLSEDDLSRTDAAAEIKGKLTYARRQRGRLVAQLRTIEVNIEQGIIPTEADLSDLAKFFPDANLTSIVEIERFHSQMRDVLNAEIQEERQRLHALIKSADNEIASAEEQQRKLGIPTKLSKAFLDKYSDLSNKIKALERQNESYTMIAELKEDVKIASFRIAEAQEQELRFLENDINAQMVRFNDFIYDGTHKPPILDLKSIKSYVFETPDDTGTGASFKSLIVFDLSVLEISPLPALAHDSLILKNIGDAPIERIMELYLQSKKQIFIALDKDDSYTEKTSKILNDTAILRLSGNGGELFGRSWNTKG